MSVVDTSPRVLHGDGNYRVVLNHTRIVLEFKDTDAAGAVRWVYIASWNSQNCNAQSSQADIAMGVIIRNLDIVTRELEERLSREDDESA